MKHLLCRPILLCLPSPLPSPPVNLCLYCCFWNKVFDFEWIIKEIPALIMSRQSTHKLYVLQRKSKTFLSCTLSGKPRPSFRVDCVREFQTFLRVDCVREFQTFLSCTLCQGIPNLPFVYTMSGNPRPSVRAHCIRESQTFLSCRLCQGVPDLPFVHTISGNPKPSFREHYVRESQTFLSCTLCQGISNLPFVHTMSGNSRPSFRVHYVRYSSRLCSLEKKHHTAAD